jgi:ATP-dependent helicase/nuclease subunit B
MTGTVVLHPVDSAGWGMGWGNPARFFGCKRVDYLVPGTRMARELHRRYLPFLRDQRDVHFGTFDQFVRELLQDRRRRLLSAIEQECLVQQAVSTADREEPFTYFRGWKSRPGWIKKMETWIGEIKRSGVLPERLMALWHDRGPKERELARIYSAYQRLLAKSGAFDHEEAYYQALQALQKGQARLPEYVVAEHFHDLSPLQEQLLIQLVTSGVPVELHLVWDGTRPRLFKETEQTMERLRRRGFSVRQVSVEPSQEGRVPALEHMVHTAFAVRPERQAADGAVEVLSAPGVEQETRMVAGSVKRWLFEENGSLSDVALIVPDLDTYLSPLVRALSEAGLPVAAPLTVPLRHHPVMETILTAMAVRMGREEERVALMQSPFVPWGSEADRRLWLKAYERWDAPQSLAELKSRMGRAEDVTADENETDQTVWLGLMSLYRWVESIPLNALWRDWLAWLESWVNELEQPSRYRRLAEDPRMLPFLAEEMQAFTLVREIIQEWKHVDPSGFAGEALELRTLAGMLERAAIRKRVRKKPGRRGGLRILEPNQIRWDRYRAVWVLGCAEGKWPRPIHDDWLLPDEERVRLLQEEVRLMTSDQLRHRQLLPFFLCASSSESYLVLSYPHADESGSARLPSPFLQELLAVWKETDVIHKRRDVSHILPARLDACVSRKEGLARAVSLLSQHGKADSVSTRKQAMALLKNEARRQPERTWHWLERLRVERVRLSGNAAAFAGRLRPSLWKRHGFSLQDRVWSPAELNQLMQCPFHYFADHLLQAREPAPARREWAAPDRGQVWHRVLCRFWRGWEEVRLSPDTWENAMERLDVLVDAMFDQLLTEAEALSRNPFRLAVEKERLKQQLSAVLSHEWHWRGVGVGSGMRPAHLELSFGMTDPNLIRRGEMDPQSTQQPVPIHLPGDVTIRVRGKVDRVDVDEDGYYAVYDYKSGTVADPKRIREGAYLQLPLFLWVVQQVLDLDPSKAVGAAFYTPGTRQNGKPPTNNRNQGLWRKEATERTGIHARVKGLMDEKEWTNTMEAIGERLSRQLRRVEHGDFAVDPTWECPSHCPHRTICRWDVTSSPAEKGEGEE